MGVVGSLITVMLGCLIVGAWSKRGGMVFLGFLVLLILLAIAAFKILIFMG